MRYVLIIILFSLASCEEQLNEDQPRPSRRIPKIVNVDVVEDSVFVYADSLVAMVGMGWFEGVPVYRVRYFPVNGKLSKDTQYASFVKAQDTTISTVQKAVYK